MKLSIQNALAGVIAAPIGVAVGFAAAWGLLPGLDQAEITSGLATTIAGAFVTVGVALFNAWMARASQVVAGAESLDTVKKVQVKDQELADSLGPKVKGPEDI